MNRRWHSIVLLLWLVPLIARAQNPSNGSLNGKYFFRHVQLTADATGSISQASSAFGSITFDGQGRFTFQGSQTLSAAPPAPSFGGSGTYQVQANGFVTMTNPQKTDALLNARLGVNAIVGSTTETANINDFFIAIPAPRTAISNASFLGTYRVATLEIPSGFAAQARNTFFTWYGNGQGGFDPFAVTGHGANLSQAVLTQTITGATYTFGSDGVATATFPAPSGTSAASALISGRKTLFISADGNLIIGASMESGGHDIVIAERVLATAATNSSLQGLFFTAGIGLGTQGLGSFSGSANSAGKGTILFTRRFHSRTTVDLTGSTPYSLASDGSGTSQMLRLAAGAAGTAFLSAAVSDFDLGNFELDFAIQSPPFSGSGTFVSPAGVVNAASFAPAGAPLAPGELFSIFGSGLAPQTASATAFPLPLQLAGVQVLVNSVAARLNYVSDSQISAFVPFAASGGRATILVNNNGRTSIPVDVPLAATAPGVFSADLTGAGTGAILHSDNITPVTATQPARRGETVVIYLTGLGATSPPVGDGLAAPSNPPSLVNANVSVLMGGISAPVVFKGLAPTFAGLYQINATVPANAPSGPNTPLAISTSEAFHDQVNIPIQ